MRESMDLTLDAEVTDLTRNHPVHDMDRVVFQEQEQDQDNQPWWRRCC